MSKDDSNTSVGDTQRTDLLMTILQELREMRDELAARDENLRGRINDLEKELELVRVEQQANGTKLAEMELSYQRQRGAERGRSPRRV